MEHTSPFAQALQSQRLTITAECLPPKGADAAAVRKLAAALPKAVNAVVVASNHEEIRACALACAALLQQEKVETIDLFLMTINGGSGGKFQMTKADAADLAQNTQIKWKDYYIRKVLF